MSSISLLWYGIAALQSRKPTACDVKIFITELEQQDLIVEAVRHEHVGVEIDARAVEPHVDTEKRRYLLWFNHWLGRPKT